MENTIGTQKWERELRIATKLGLNGGTVLIENNPKYRTTFLVILNSNPLPIVYKCNSKFLLFSEKEPK
jgi:hypothetical protein